MTTQLLDVYYHHIYAGQLSQQASGKLSFHYDAAYRAHPDAIAFSMSLPLDAEGFTEDAVKAYFSGLLPDETIREYIAGAFGVSEKNAFALLKAIGGECAGALSFYPTGQKPFFEKHAAAHLDLLTQDQLSDILKRLQKRPLLAGEDGYRLSLAGAQNKLAVGFIDNQIKLIKNGAPTTHILKPLIARVSDSVHNEFFCMKLARIMGIDTPEVFMYHHQNIPYYLVTRYDRHRSKDGSVMRVHQEDFCQALSIPAEMKYEREGGPSIAQCQALITTHSKQPALDMHKFMMMVQFNYLIGNNDAHGKNFSFLYKDKKPVLAPAYDLLSTAIYPELSRKMAMKIGGKYNPEDVFQRHWHQIIPNTQAAHKAFDKNYKIFGETLLKSARSLKEKLKDTVFYSPIYTDIENIIEQRIAQKC